LIILDWLELSNDLLDEYVLDTDDIADLAGKEKAYKRNDMLGSYRGYVGKVGRVSVIWIKDSVQYLYAGLSEDGQDPSSRRTRLT
jgi:hypothetical protein